MDEQDLCYQSATGLAGDIATRKLSPVELIETFLGRIERLNPKINAYCTLTADQARAEAKRAEAAVMRGEALGPLHGVPVSIKDLIITRDVRTTRGSRLHENFVPDQDAPLVERLRSAGAIILGKTNTPEYGWKGVTDNLIFGPTRNPWDFERTPGGSSGGASAQVAAGLGPLAIGTDGGGSIRIPASFAGIYGLKPSFGRVPVYPTSPGEAISHAGPMANYVRDAALLLNVIAGPDERDRNSLPAAEIDYLAACDGPAGGPSAGSGHDLEGLRVGWSPDLGYAPVEEEVRRITGAAASRFADFGCHFEQVDLDWPDPEPAWNYFFYGTITAAVSERWEANRALLDPGLAEIAEKWLTVGMLDYIRAHFARAAFWEQVRRFFERYDLLLTPTMPLAAFAIMRNAPGQVAGRPIKGLGWSPFALPFNLTGQPAASLPCGFTAAGLPVGLQVIGRRHADATVLRASAVFEAAAPWQQHRPAL